MVFHYLKMKITKAIRACKIARKTLGRFLFNPIPGTAPLMYYASIVLPTLQFLKRSFCLAMVVIYFTTQIVFAQNVIRTLPPGTLPNLMFGMRLKMTSLFNMGRLVFHSLPYGFDKARENRERSGYLSPDKIVEREKEQMERVENPQEILKDKGLLRQRMPQTGPFGNVARRNSSGRPWKP